MVAPKMPYRIELVGVTCDPGLAVARGIWCARVGLLRARKPCVPRASPPPRAHGRAALGRGRAGGGYARAAACPSTCSCARTGSSPRTSRSLRTWWTAPRCTTPVRALPAAYTLSPRPGLVFQRRWVRSWWHAAWSSRQLDTCEG